jgi:hypothetical protein
LKSKTPSQSDKIKVISKTFTSKLTEDRIIQKIKSKNKSIIMIYDVIYPIPNNLFMFLEIEVNNFKSVIKNYIDFICSLEIGNLCTYTLIDDCKGDKFQLKKVNTIVEIKIRQQEGILLSQKLIQKYPTMRACRILGYMDIIVLSSSKDNSIKVGDDIVVTARKSRLRLSMPPRSYSVKVRHKV